MGGGVGGMSNEKLATLRSIAIGGARMNDVPAAFPDAGENAVNSDQTAGNVGLYVLSRFRLITDYPHNALWLTANPQALVEPFAKNRAGLDFTPSPDKLVVMLVRPGSPAARSGWKEGVEVIAIDGHRIDPRYSGSALSHWTEQPSGTVVSLTLSDGSTRQLTLADYY
jgi:hypothetical protein